MTEEDVNAELLAAAVLRDAPAPLAPVVSTYVPESIFDEDPVSTHQAAIEQLFSALGDPIRLEIVAQLRVYTTSPGYLAASLELAPSVVAYHLQILERAGIIHIAKTGRTKNITLRGDVSGLLDAALRVVARQA